MRIVFPAAIQSSESSKDKVSTLVKYKGFKFLLSMVFCRVTIFSVIFSVI